MIITPVRATSLFATEGNRLDARYFSAPAMRIKSVLASSPGVDLRSLDDMATTSAPSRFKRTYATEGEDYVSYLRPYDVFEFLPPEADRLSVSRTEKLDEYQIRAGDILQTCSGRNLGPLTIADEYLARFALSHDMIRIRIDDEDDRFYALAFLKSRTGQHLLRGDLSGSVIDHITPDQVRAIQIPVIDSIRDAVVALTKHAVDLRGRARITLHASVEALDALFDVRPARPHRDGWTVRAADLGSRLDAAYHSAHVERLRGDLLEDGGVRLGDVSLIRKPGGRYKTYYVGPDQGTPLLSGRQILQLDLVGAKNISSRSVKPESGYELEQGWITFQADGRAEESLGYPSVVTAEREGWFASGHVGRVIPLNPDDSGWLWAAIASQAVQQQIAAQACGSVVDALYPELLESVVLPRRDLVDSDAVNAAWKDLATAAEEMSTATERVDAALADLGV